MNCVFLVHPCVNPGIDLMMFMICVFLLQDRTLALSSTVLFNYLVEGLPSPSPSPKCLCNVGAYQCRMFRFGDLWSG